MTKSWIDLCPFERGSRLLTLKLIYVRNSASEAYNVYKITLEIDQLCDYCRKAKCMMSPSSGPLHLAALCGTEIIVWSGDSYNEHRYKKAWNPFNNNVQYINGWGNVDISKIKQSIDNLDE